jgi:hypothetical protein
MTPTIERNKVDANIYIDRAIAMLKDESEDNQYIAGYNGIVSLLQYAKESHAASLNRQGWEEKVKKEAIDFHYWIYNQRRYSMYNEGWWDSGVSPQEYVSTGELYRRWKSMPLPNKPSNI